MVSMVSPWQHHRNHYPSMFTSLQWCMVNSFQLSHRCSYNYVSQRQNRELQSWLFSCSILGDANTLLGSTLTVCWIVINWVKATNHWPEQDVPTAHHKSYHTSHTKVCRPSVALNQCCCVIHDTRKCMGFINGRTALIAEVMLGTVPFPQMETSL